MKVVHISTGYHHGGAAIACKRLVEAQREVGIDASVITQEKGVADKFVLSTTGSKIKGLKNLISLTIEKIYLLLYLKSAKDVFHFSIGIFGENVSDNQIFKDADIVHLHWINAGFLSITGLTKILKSNKKIVWTMHDIWPFTGGCHIALDCKNYQKECVDCFYVRFKKNSFSSSFQNRKRKMYSSGSITFIAPSNWQRERALSSSLLNNNSIKTIHNPVNLFHISQDKKSSRQLFSLPLDRKLVLFVAFNLKDKHKGFNYLVDAFNEAGEKFAEETDLVVIGKPDEIIYTLKFKVHSLGYISDEQIIRKVYSAVDVFVSSSIEDNLPNTILESLSVGTPVTAFQTGGIPEMVVHHENGYLARYKDSADLFKGIVWCLDNNEDGKLSKNAIRKIESSFSYQAIGEQFKTFYSDLISQ